MSAPGKHRAGGVLPVNAAATKKSLHVPRAGNRPPAPKLRLIVRRLPPGLVESEFWASLGDEWQVSKGKIESAAFKDGKISRDPAKPSRPARAYLKIKDQSFIDALSAKVKATTFQDVKNTTKDSCLLGPPSLEFAPYNKMATARIRHDGRQGTIDQDQEFIDFLQSLTEPVVKPTANGADAENSQEKVTITPLVQYLKDKKANKAKEAAEKKSAKQKEAKEAKEKKSSTVAVKGSTPATEKARVAKATQDAVKAINKSVASMQANKQPAATAKTETKSTTAKETAAPATPAKRERERGSATAAARMLQRDLGLAPRSPRAARATPTSSTTAKIEPAASSEKATTTAALAQEQKPPPTPSNATPPTGPKNARVANTPTPKPTPAPSSRPAKPLLNPSVGAKSAFLKHANPSQGVTEELLRVAFEAFGTVTRCEIDKKKGLGYVDFDEMDSLKQAMHASPVKVGNGQVVVLENRNVKRGQQAQTATPSNPSVATATVAQSPVQKTGVPASATSAPSSNTASPVQAAATPAVQSTSDTTAEATSTPNPPSSPATTTTPPTAPRGSARGGVRGGVRGNRGGFAAAGRGNGPRAAFRGGGRGSFGPRGGRAAAQAVAAANNSQSAAQNNPAPTPSG